MNIILNNYSIKIFNYNDKFKERFVVDNFSDIIFNNILSKVLKNL